MTRAKIEREAQRVLVEAVLAFGGIVVTFDLNGRRRTFWLTARDVTGEHRDLAQVAA